MRRSPVFALCAAAVALTYFAFRVELFDDEYEASHPDAPGSTVTFAAPTLNWETFDKDNAPQAFTFTPIIRIDVVAFVSVPRYHDPSLPPPTEPVRDKSPPLPFSA